MIRKHYDEKHREGGGRERDFLILIRRVDICSCIYDNAIFIDDEARRKVRPSKSNQRRGEAS